jgi:small-conductance mechanosensitive channel
LAVIAGAVPGEPAAVALGGFIGIVFAFASQQVLGQTLAGLLILLARPFTTGAGFLLRARRARSRKRRRSSPSW